MFAGVERGSISVRYKKRGITKEERVYPNLLPIPSWYTQEVNIALCLQIKRKKCQFCIKHN